MAAIFLTPYHARYFWLAQRLLDGGVDPMALSADEWNLHLWGTRSLPEATTELDDDCINDPDGFLRIMKTDEDRMGRLVCLHLNPYDFKDEGYALFVHPERDTSSVVGDKVMIKTGDGAQALFKTSNERDGFLKRFVTALIGKISLSVAETREKS